MIPPDAIRAMFAAYLKGYRDGDGRAMVEDFVKKYPDQRQRLLFFVTDMLRGFNP